jgi:hypothetical protein
MNDYKERTKNGTSFVASDVNIFVLASLASGLRLYAKTGIKPNRNWTPTNMLKTASQHTGKTYKRGQFEQAAKDLTDIVETAKALPRNSNN